MNIYEKKIWWKLGLLFFACIIILITLIYNNKLASRLAIEEEKKAYLLSLAYKEILSLDASNTKLIVESATSTENTTIPIIITDKNGEVLLWRNIPGIDEEKSIFSDQDTARVRKELKKIIQQGRPPLEIEAIENFAKLYYSESYLLTALRQYPYIQFCIISLFLLVSYLAFSAARKAEQNQVWVGMARETAHQLGTPLSSLIGWIELVKQREESQPRGGMALGAEMEKDIGRLALIADRFSKIGSKPTLELHPLSECLQKTMEYVKRISSEKITYTYILHKDPGKLPLSPPLFDWVIENILKNALDAMGNKGKLLITLDVENNEAVIDIKDSGKGIPKSRQKEVFKPGFSTKRRGWGLGLSLSKRIVEEYHHGKIFVLESMPDAGTTFRIILPLSQ